MPSEEPKAFNASALNILLPPTCPTNTLMSLTIGPTVDKAKTDLWQWVGFWTKGGGGVILVRHAGDYFQIHDISLKLSRIGRNCQTVKLDPETIFEAILWMPPPLSMDR